MAWWGVAYALGPNYNQPLDAARNKKALDAVRKAQALASHANETEQAYITAIATRYSDDPAADRATLDREFAKAMKGLYERYPDDVDAAVLYAESMMNLRPWQLWTIDGKPQPGTEEILRVLEKAIKLDPGHIGAHHFYIHAIEASPNAARALPSAERLKVAAPAAGHLVHMPAHVYIRTGNYRGAIEANAAAARADEAYFAATKAEGFYPMMYYTHNYMFLATAAAMIGRSGEAVSSARKAVSIVQPMAGHDPMAEYALPWALYTLVRCAKWDDILATPQPNESTPFTVAMWRYARAQAYLAKGDTATAQTERQAFETAAGKVPADLMVNVNRAHDLLGIAGHVLSARLASVVGNREAAFLLWVKAIAIEDQLVYDEPPAWYYPVRESLGGEYLRAKHYAEAETVFRDDLRLNPNNPRSLYGLEQALRAQQKNVEAAETFKRFDKEWKGADVPISVGSL
jgi:tetratricopeptide (TPR) repeat protein